MEKHKFWSKTQFGKPQFIPFQGCRIFESSNNQPTYFTVQKMKFSIKDFFRKCDRILSFLRIWSQILNGKLHFLCSAFRLALVMQTSYFNLKYLKSRISFLKQITVDYLIVIREKRIQFRKKTRISRKTFQLRFAQVTGSIYSNILSKTMYVSKICTKLGKIQSVSELSILLNLQISKLNGSPN